MSQPVKKEKLNPVQNFYKVGEQIGLDFRHYLDRNQAVILMKSSAEQNRTWGLYRELTYSRLSNGMSYALCLMAFHRGEINFPYLRGPHCDVLRRTKGLLIDEVAPVPDIFPAEYKRLIARAEGFFLQAWRMSNFVAEGTQSMFSDGHAAKFWGWEDPRGEYVPRQTIEERPV